MAITKKITRVGDNANQLVASSQKENSTSKNASGTGRSGNNFVPTAEAKGRAVRLRLFAVAVWICAIAAEVGAILVLRAASKPIESSSWLWVGGLAVIDLGLVIIGSSLWKKANRLDPASRSNAVRFFVQNQLGVIISIVAFLPFILVVMADKSLSAKEKGVTGGVAAVLLAVAGLASADFNPPSVEQYTEQTQRVEQLMGTNDVYWTRYGTKYHLFSDCKYLRGNRTDEIFEGTVAKARELKNITELCKVCEHRAEKAEIGTGAAIGE